MSCTLSKRGCDFKHCVRQHTLFYFKVEHWLTKELGSVATVLSCALQVVFSFLFFFGIQEKIRNSFDCPRQSNKFASVKEKRKPWYIHIQTPVVVHHPTMLPCRRLIFICVLLHLSIWKVLLIYLKIFLFYCE